MRGTDSGVISGERRGGVSAHRRENACGGTRGTGEDGTGRERGQDSTGQDRTGEREERESKKKLGRPMHVGIRYLGGGLIGGQQLFLSSLELLKHFISFVFSNTQFLFQLSYIVL